MEPKKKVDGKKKKSLKGLFGRAKTMEVKFKPGKGVDEKKAEENSKFKKSDFITNPYFTTASLLAIIINTMVMAMYKKDMTTAEASLQEYSNIFFTVLFSIEMVIKLWCLGGPKNYSKDPFNVFDTILVIISLIDLYIANYGGGSIDLSALKVLRSIRMVRIFKLAKRSENLLTLFQAIKETLKDVAYFMLLLIICIFIFALVGMEWFAYTVRLKNIND